MVGNERGGGFCEKATFSQCTGCGTSENFPDSSLSVLRRMSPRVPLADEANDEIAPSETLFGDRGLVFLSHSSRPREEHELGAGDTLQRHEHRKAYLKRLLAALGDRLPPLGFATWLDQKDLEKGECFDTLIYDALLRCRSAVILIDRDALDSEYVLAEATILTFRRTVGDPVHLLPVLLGDVTDKDVKASRLGRVLRLDALLPLRPANRKQNGSAALSTADEITQELDESITPCDDADSSTQRWIDHVSSYLSRVTDEALRRAAKTIGVDSEEWQTTRHKPRALAAAFLSCEPGLVYKALQELVPQLDPHQVQRAVQYVQPLWVDLGAAQVVMAANNRSAPDRVVGLSTRAYRLGKNLAERATAGDWRYHIHALPEITGEDTINELVERCDRTLRDALNLSHHDTPQQLAAQLTDMEGVFVVLRCDSGDPSTARAVMEELRVRFPGIVIVALAPADHRLWKAEKIKSAYESFTRAKERAARKYVSDTAKLADDEIKVDSDD
ncbi:toll/interleukin-1 receptor domain-containing protein [Streptomyces sp. A244]|uniref:toll/interleukin-1 receptor domain-containing protein n=1 Tax=Streptomyces sp. A244 TaxID=2137016 RepID=UPI0011B27917|nr:toll/interleukin-1 receptor domain-containing protein [Streptomyces sp. A244]